MVAVPVMSHYPMKNLNLRDWDRNGDMDDLTEVDDEEAEREYRKAEREAVEMVRDGVWR